MSRHPGPQATPDPLAFLAVAGEMGERTRAFDWSTTPVGPAAGWPQSLKTTARILLDSRYAMWLGWGPDFTFFYNDAYARMSLGPKHPWALGRPAREVWAEIWGEVGPRAESVVRTGQATWDEGLLLFLERRGFTEETYHTFSYSPVPDDAGGVGGMLCVVTEDTGRAIGERRLRTLRELAARTTEESRSVEEACRSAARTLGENPRDLPFVLIYLLDADGTTARLAASAGLPDGSPAAPPAVPLAGRDGRPAGWPLRSVLESGHAEVVGGLEGRFGPLPGAAWPEPPRQAVVLPLAKPGQTQPAGFVVAGASPRLLLDDGYKGFLDLLAGHVATAVASARAYEEERKRAEALAELDRAKTAFFSNVSHEFRTPLTLMLGPVEELLARSHTDLAPAAAAQLEVVNRNGLRLLRLVNSLLDFSRIEAGRVRAAYRATDLAAYTADLASVFRSACERAGLVLTVDCQPLGEPAFVDREMWEKVVLNLLSNAFKFTFEGGIDVSLRRAGGAAELRVRDTGTGIPAGELPRLFERFHRVENARGRTHEGSGIGLALVQELARLHGGSVAVASEVGRGTTFTVTVPLGSAHLPPEHVADGRAAAPAGAGAMPFVEEALRWLPGDPGHGGAPELPAYAERLPTPYRPPPGDEADDRPRVLVADDNADMRQYVARLLAEEYRVETAPDGEAALASARERPPDLVLSDVMMPRLDGFGLLRELRAEPRTHGIPIILLSARAGEESRVEGMEAGADDYLVKPFGARELLARVSAHLKMARMRREAGASLRESEERFRALVTASSDVVYRMSPDWSEMQPLDGRGLGTSNAEPIRDWMQKNVPAFEHARVREAIGRAVSGKRTFELEHQVIRADGSPGWTFSRAVPILDAVGAVVEWFGAASDVTARKQAAAALRARTDELESLLTSAPLGLAFFDRGHRYVRVNEELAALNGIPAADHLGRTVAELLPENAPTVDPVIDRVFETGRAVSGLEVEGETPARPGARRHWLTGFYPVRNGSGEVEAVGAWVTEITEQKQAEEELREAEGRFRTLADNIPQLAWMADADGYLFWYNRRWLAYTGATLEGMKGWGWQSVHDPAELPRVLAKFKAHLASGEPWEDTFPLRRHDGEFRWFLSRAVPVRDAGGRVVRWFGTNTDVTQQRELEHALKEADRRKDEFLATLAHELRNPLAPLRNGLQILRLSGHSRESVEKAGAIMERQLGQMVRLIDDLLDVSRISRGKVGLRRERLPLADVLERAVETSRPLIDQAGHTLEVELPAAPAFVDADPVRLAQVFANLLNNAAKYTERGGRIRLEGSRGGGQVVVRVRDSGVGIHAAMLPRVFDLFTQVDRSLDRSQGGLGIGLSLVKGLVELHGGTVEAHSEGAGRGSEFVVRLPEAPAPGSVPAATAGAAHAPSGTRRVLVADDNRDAATSMAQMLSLMGNETRTAHDGLEAVRAAAEFRPEVVLLDLGMPRLDGYDAARRIRSQPGGRDVLLVALTGWGQNEDRQRTREAGFDLHLVKPLDPAALEKLMAATGSGPGGA